MHSERYARGEGALDRNGREYPPRCELLPGVKGLTSQAKTHLYYKVLRSVACAKGEYCVVVTGGGQKVSEIGGPPWVMGQVLRIVASAVSGGSWVIGQALTLVKYVYI